MACTFIFWPNSFGISILSKLLDMKVRRVERLEETLVLANFYILNNLAEYSMIIGGDFNVTLNPLLEKLWQNISNLSVL